MAARRLAELNPATYSSVEALGLCVIDAGTESQIADLAGIYKGLGKRTFALCDKQADSAKAAMETTVELLFMHGEKGIETIVGGRQSATKRLRNLLVTICQMNAERYVGDSKLHEMVTIAMEENWDVCSAHMEHITGAIGVVIADGSAAGEFYAPGVELAAMCTCTSMLR